MKTRAFFILILLSMMCFLGVNAQEEPALYFDSLRFLDDYYRDRDSGWYSNVVLPMEVVQQIGWGYFQDAAWFPDSARFALATSEGIWIYDRRDPDLSPTLFQKQGAVAITISDDGTLLAASLHELVTNWGQSNTRTVWGTRQGAGNPQDSKVWNLQTGEVIQTFEAADQLDFSPDSKRLAIVKGHTITIMDVMSGELLHQHTYSNFVFRDILYWDANRLLLVIDNFCCGVGPIDLKLMDVETGEVTPLCTRIGVKYFLWKDSEAQMLYLYSNYPYTQLDMTTFPPLAVKQKDAPFFQYHRSQDYSNEMLWDILDSWVSPNQAYVLRMDASSALFEVMEIATSNVVAQGEYAYISGLMIRLTPDGSGLATVIQANRIGIWNFEQGDWSHFLDGHTDTITDMFFTSDTTLYSASEDGTVRVWNLATDDSTVLVDLPKYRILAIHPGLENEILVSRCLRGSDGQEGGILRLDIHTGERFKVEHAPGEIEEILLNGDACYDSLMSGFRWVMYGDQQNFYVPSADGNIVKVIPLPQVTPTDDLTMRWEASGDYLLSFGDTGAVTRWEKPQVEEVADGSLRYSWPPSTTIAVHENPVTAVAAYSPTMTFSAACSYYKYNGMVGGPYEICAGADLILTDYNAHWVSQIRQSLVGHTAPIRDMVVHPNEKVLITASEDGTILIWGIEEPGGSS